MPVYDYLCEDCGPFTLMRPMAEYDMPQVCPGCGIEAPRAILRAPHFACVSSETRRAHETNERSAHAPQTLSALKSKHGPGCGCCAAPMKSRTKRSKSGAKSFPSARPWMISH